MPIKEIIVCNVGSGDNSVIKVQDNSDPGNETKFLLADIGTKEHALQEFEENLTEGRNDTSVFFTHMHTDHIGALDRLLALHTEKKINLETVYLPTSILSSREYIKLLDKDNTNVEIKSLTTDRQECMNILGYLNLYYGKSSQEFKTALKAINKARKEANNNNQKIDIKDVDKKVAEIQKEMADKDFLLEYEEIEKEEKFLLANESNIKDEIDKLTDERKKHAKDFGRKNEKYTELTTIIKDKQYELEKISKNISHNKERKEKAWKHYENITAEVKKLFQDVRKLNNAGIKIMSINEKEETEVVEKYGIKITCYPSKKVLQKERIREMVHKNELRKKFGLIYDGPGTDIEKLQQEHAITFLIKECKGTQDDLLSEGKVAYLLINKMFSHEGNQGNVVFQFEDDKTKYLCTGDMEMTQEFQFLLEDIEVSCDLFKIAHHYSRTSNSPFFLEKVLIDSVAAGKKPIFVASMSLGDLHKYKEEIEKKENIMKYSTHKTFNGSLKLKIIDDKKYIQTESVQRDCEQMCIDCLKEALKTDKEEKKKELIELANKMEKFSKEGIPAEDFIETYSNIEYQKYATFVYEHIR